MIIARELPADIPLTDALAKKQGYDWILAIDASEYLIKQHRCEHAAAMGFLPPCFHWENQRIIRQCVCMGMHLRPVAP